jgi:CelD/BcsL family acetyltransferase involved in cellulose biosynthesis
VRKLRDQKLTAKCHRVGKPGTVVAKGCATLGTINDTGWSTTGTAGAGLATLGAFSIDRNVESVRECAFEIDPLLDPRWAGLLDRHPQASVFHSPNWLQALRTVYGYAPVVVTTCPPGTSLSNGLVFCRIKSWLTGQRLVSLPFSDHCEPLVDSSDELDDMLLYMRHNVDKDSWKSVEIRPISREPSSHTKFARGVTYCFHRLDLSRSAEDLFRSFHKDCVQRKIRRAERENLKYEEGTSENLLQEFYRLVVLTRRRQCLPPQPLKWFRGLISAFGKNLKIRMASKDGVGIAGILTLSHKKSMVYKYGCSDAKFNRFGGTPLLFWKTIQEAKDRGFEEFDLGRSDSDNLGLIAFKDRWCGQRALLQYWNYPNRPSRPTASWKKGLAKQVVSAAPDLALVEVGRLLYRHMG